MTRYLLKLIVLLAFISVAVVDMYGQSATGIISGAVTDSTEAVIPDASVTITNKATSAVRSLKTNEKGLFSAPGLEAGQYTVRTEMAGFKTSESEAEVQAGSSTTVNMVLSLGQVTEVVTVSGATPEMDYESHSVTGVIDHQSIENLPLNGRSFLQLASLQPGVTVVTQAQASRNAPIGISILGGGGQYALVSMDGLQINDYHDGYAGAGTSINFSQEVVQEFQLSSANFDLSIGTTMQGAVNLVTRSGSNAFHGSAFLFYRDHNMAAYPGLTRNALDPHPYFSRLNPGVTFSGPIKKDKLFMFASYEFINQKGVVISQPDLASIAPEAGIFPSPFKYHFTTVRWDYQATPRNVVFLRWTNDENTGYAGTGGVSSWTNNYNWSDQIALGVTTTLTPNLVGEFRAAYRDWENNETNTTAAQCGSCFGGPVSGLAPNGLPTLAMVGSSNFAGGTAAATQRRLARNYEINYVLSWQKGSHRIKLGGDVDYYNELFNYPLCAYGCMSVYSVENTKTILGAQTATYAPNLPSTVTTTADLLNLPIYNTSGGLSSGFQTGPSIEPGAYEQGKERRNYHPRVFAQDVWKARTNFTVNYGFAYSYTTGNYPADMPIPGILAPLYGLPAGTTQPGTPPNKLILTPAFGFTYSPGTSGKWIIRGGAGIYFDTGNYVDKLHDQAYIGPIGNGPIHIPATYFTNIFPNIVQQGPGGSLIPLAIGAPLPTTTFTNITLAQFLQIYNQQFPAINSSITPATLTTSGPYKYSNLDLIKTGSELFRPHSPVARSYQTSIGVQRELGRGMVLTLDWARRQGENLLSNELDANYYSQYINGVNSPLIPKCTSAQILVANQECSTGAFSTLVFGSRSVYEGLLVKLNKRLSNRYQFIVSYALQNQNTNSLGIVNLNNYRESYGANLARHNLNISGIGYLPWGFELSLNSSIITTTPMQPVTTTIDLSGTGATSATPLPGNPYKCYGLTCGKSQLVTALAAFNSTYAGTKAPNGATIPTYVLPPNYAFGKPTIAQDFRLTKVFTLREKYKLAILGEVFNTFNIANLTGYSANLDTLKATGQTYAFGQPTARAGQVFNSSGPRAEQVGARITF